MTNIERIKVIVVLIGISVLGLFFPVVWLLPIWMAAAYGWAQATNRATILVNMTTHCFGIRVGGRADWISCVGHSFD